MVKVLVWNYRGKRDAWGHASIFVSHTYISWWPVPAPRVRSKIHPDIYAAHPRMPRFEDDVRDEGGPPNYAIPIRGLDERQIVLWWYRIFPWAASREGPPSIPWSSLDWNCSKVVATALREGGGDKFAEWSKSWNLIWTPNDVREYAQSIATGLAR